MDKSIAGIRMSFQTKKPGFTIVELLIVIVVIAILAAISIVAYNGIQARARDNIRYQDAKNIMKALELYKIDNGNYPIGGVSTPTYITGTAVCSTHNNGYSYSDASDNTWMQPLVAGGYLKKVPTPSDNGCNSYYRYLGPSATSYGCTTRNTSYYVLQIVGTDGSTTPTESIPYFKPCPETTASWGTNSSIWTFAKDNN